MTKHEYIQHALDSQGDAASLAGAIDILAGWLEDRDRRQNNEFLPVYPVEELPCFLVRQAD